MPSKKDLWREAADTSGLQEADRLIERMLNVGQGEMAFYRHITHKIPIHAAYMKWLVDNRKSDVLVKIEANYYDVMAERTETYILQKE